MEHIGNINLASHLTQHCNITNIIIVNDSLMFTHMAVMLIYYMLFTYDNGFF